MIYKNDHKTKTIKIQKQLKQKQLKNPERETKKRQKAP